jgi:hypothetical protein
MQQHELLCYPPETSGLMQFVARTAPAGVIRLA